MEGGGEGEREGEGRGRETERTLYSFLQRGGTQEGREGTGEEVGRRNGKGE